MFTGKYHKQLFSDGILQQCKRVWIDHFNFCFQIKSKLCMFVSGSVVVIIITENFSVTGFIYLGTHGWPQK